MRGRTALRSGRRGELYTPLRGGEPYTPGAAGKEKDQKKKDGVDGGVGVWVGRRVNVLVGG